MQKKSTKIIQIDESNCHKKPTQNIYRFLLRQIDLGFMQTPSVFCEKTGKFITLSREELQKLDTERQIEEQNKRLIEMREKYARKKKLEEKEVYKCNFCDTELIRGSISQHIVKKHPEYYAKIKGTIYKPWTTRKIKSDGSEDAIDDRFTLFMTQFSQATEIEIPKTLAHSEQEQD